LTTEGKFKGRRRRCRSFMQRRWTLFRYQEGDVL